MFFIRIYFFPYPIYVSVYKYFNNETKSNLDKSVHLSK